jgi:cytoskeletal protein CcmA (bactofilin family)
MSYNILSSNLVLGLDTVPQYSFVTTPSGVLQVEKLDGNTSGVEVDGCVLADQLQISGATGLRALTTDGVGRIVTSNVTTTILEGLNQRVLDIEDPDKTLTASNVVTSNIRPTTDGNILVDANILVPEGTIYGNTVHPYSGTLVIEGNASMQALQATTGTFTGNLETDTTLLSTDATVSSNLQTGNAIVLGALGTQTLTASGNVQAAHVIGNITTNTITAPSGTVTINTAMETQNATVSTNLTVQDTLIANNVDPPGGTVIVSGDVDATNLHADTGTFTSNVDCDTLDATTLLTAPLTSTANISTNAITSLGGPTGNVYMIGNVVAGETVYTSNIMPLQAGNVIISGNLTAFDVNIKASDARLKTDIRPIEHALDKVCQLQGVHFTWKEGLPWPPQPDVGVIAQEVEAVLPEAVTQASFDVDVFGNSKSQQSYKAVDGVSNKLTALLIQAVKELRGEVEMLKRHT